MRVLVTGGGGFIGSNVVDRFLQLGASVIAYDNFFTGQREFLSDASRHAEFEIVEADLLDAECLSAAMAGADHPRQPSKAEGDRGE